jgi:hypothetical protein
MNTEKYRRIRQLILDSTAIYRDGVSFDTKNAPEKGYSKEEIAIANHLFANCGFFTTDFISKIKFINDDPDNKSRIYL